MAKRNHKKIIGFDLDGVILDHTMNKLQLARRFGWELKPEQTPSEAIRRIIPEPVLNQLQGLLYDDPKISLLSPVMRGAKNALEELRNRHPYFLISRRRNPQWAVNILKFKRLWPKFFNEKNAFFVTKPEDKNKMCLELNVTHYIDDELKILEELAGVENKILFDAHNSFPHLTRFRKVGSWKELIDLIRG